LDAATGAVVWQTANPSGYKSLSPMTLAAGGVVFGCSLDPDGMCYALDAANGHVIKAFKTGASNGGGVAINQGKMVVGAGYNGLNDLIGLGGDAADKQIQVWVVPGAPADPLATTPPATGGGGTRPPRSGSNHDD
jgi:outer membrane protein assembly factor BamB